MDDRITKWMLCFSESNPKKLNIRKDDEVLITAFMLIKLKNIAGDRFQIEINNDLSEKILFCVADINDNIDFEGFKAR
jgi:hypothetical protein